MRIERHEIIHNSGKETAELVELYESRGARREVAREMAQSVMSDTDQALEVHAREELGVDPANLGSPAKAAAASFGSFVLGAFVPLVPWLFAGDANSTKIAVSMLLAAAGALSVGYLIGQLSGQSRLRAATRQLVLAALECHSGVRRGHSRRCVDIDG